MEKRKLMILLGNTEIRPKRLKWECQNRKKPLNQTKDEKVILSFFARQTWREIPVVILALNFNMSINPIQEKLPYKKKLERNDCR